MAVITAAVPFLSSAGGETVLMPSVSLIALVSFVSRGSVAGFSAAFFCLSSYRVSAPRAAVVSALNELGCSVTAQEISECLRERGEGVGVGVGVASIYRALQLLDDMRLVRRVDVGEPVARYEPVYPNGEDHHHLVCDRCGQTKAFEDQSSSG
ncbi:MAG: transcriptional repressor [Thermoleophilaceae bacterium]